MCIVFYCHVIYNRSCSHRHKDSFTCNRFVFFLSFSSPFLDSYPSQHFSEVFHWVDGTELHFKNWVTGAPDSLSEKCGEMTDYGSFRGKWNDKHCSSPQPFICEIGSLWNPFCLVYFLFLTTWLKKSSKGLQATTRWQTDLLCRLLENFLWIKLTVEVTDWLTVQAGIQITLPIAWNDDLG